MSPATHPPPDAVHADFLARLAASLAASAADVTDGRFLRLVLARPSKQAGAEPDLQRVTVRPLLLRGQPHLSFVHSHSTRDITKNLPVDHGLAWIAQLLGTSFRNAHLFTAQGELQLSLSKKGKGQLSTHAAPAAGANDDATDPAQDAAHDRPKHRLLSLDRPFLAALGITTPQHTLVPAMARKWKQINKFLEVFAHALDSSPLKDAGSLRVVDFGAGKAYLSFAVHDWLTHTRGIEAHVTGVELRDDLVQQGRHTIHTLQLQGMHIDAGDVRRHAPQPMDVMIALHACDTATDHAIHLGLRAGAQIILCSPCCHKQLRPQLLSPHPLKSVFQHGIHAEQQAEMVTDSLRALLLEAQGYETQVFEFVALEHTRKNKMILAVKRRAPQPAAAQAAMDQVTELKRFFGVREQALDLLLQAG